MAFTTHLRVLASSFLRFRDHTQWHNTVDRTPLDEWSARRTWQDTQHSQEKNSHVPGGICFFFFLVLAFYLGRTSLSWLSWRLPFILTVHHTQHKHLCPAGIRTRSLSRRAVVEPRLRPLGHWDRQKGSIVFLIFCTFVKNLKHIFN
jgi:hypothetical protein